MRRMSKAERFLRELKSQVGKYYDNEEDFAEAANIPIATYNRRKRLPGQFKMDELARMSIALHTTVSELIRSYE